MNMLSCKFTAIPLIYDVTTCFMCIHIKSNSAKLRKSRWENISAEALHISIFAADSVLYEMKCILNEDTKALFKCVTFFQKW